MSQPLLSVGELIDQSWDVFRTRMSDLISISAWLLVTAILFAVALALFPSASTLAFGADLSPLETTGVLLFALTSFVITPIISFWIYIALTKAISAHIARKTVDPKTAMREARALFFQTLLTSVMVMLVILLAVVIGFVPAAILAAIGSLMSLPILVIIANIFLILGIFIALILGVKWVMYYFMAPYITIIDGVAGTLALSTSRQLIEGRFWAVLIRIAVPKLVFIIFGVFAMSLVAYVVGIAIDVATGLNLDVQLRISTMTQTIVPTVIAVLINPLIVISDVLLLRSLRS